MCESVRACVCACTRIVLCSAISIRMRYMCAHARYCDWWAWAGLLTTRGHHLAESQSQACYATR